MMKSEKSSITERLREVLRELEGQKPVGDSFPEGRMSFSENVAFVHELIEHDECGIAYESLVAMLEQHSFVITGPTSIRLLEAALLFGYKTTRPEDSTFDRAQKTDK